MKAVVSVKVDKDIKTAAQEIASSAGISLSSLINAYLRQICATRRIEIFAPEPMTPQLESLIAEVEKERLDGLASAEFDNVNDFIRALEA